MRVAIAQLDPVVGAFELNVKKIQDAYTRACAENARILLTPELSVSGYPLLDLLDRPEIFDRTENALQALRVLTVGKPCALAVGHVGVNSAPNGRAARNEVSIFENGKRVFNQAKTLLPSYDVFDESRYFEPAQEIQVWNCDGVRVGVAICEDLWAQSRYLKNIYKINPVEKYRELGVGLLLSIASSPYEWGKKEERNAVHQAVARHLGVPLVYVNQVGATDEILFDGSSFALDAKGKFLEQLPAFETGFSTVGVFEHANERGLEPVDSEDSIAVLAKGLVLGIREYFERTGFKSAILGLSGGIDSAVVGTLAARALGPRNVLGVAMPSQYSSAHSLEDAEILAHNLGIQYEVHPIKFLFSTAARVIGEGRDLNALSMENLQARLRALILMTLSNQGIQNGKSSMPALVITTGNKSEIAMGYCTLYGDMVGALAPLGDLFKTQVYQLAKYINQSWESPIPERSLTKPPSAELRPDQKDQDALPPYDLLDRFLAAYLEFATPLAELEKTFREPLAQHSFQVKDLLRKLEVNEYKRRQSAPVLKVSRRAFGIGRRVPLAKRWDAFI